MHVRSVVFYPFKEYTQLAYKHIFNINGNLKHSLGDLRHQCEEFSIERDR